MTDQHAGSAPSVHARNLTGVLWMLAAMVTITVMFAILKHATATMPIMMAAFARTLVAFLLLTPWLLMSGGPGTLATRRLGGHFLRSFFGISSFACITYAIAHLLLADATLLSFTTPFWTILIVAALGRERIRARRLAATGVGFIGVLMIVRPQSGIEPAALVALTAALLSSLAIIQMKDLTRTEPPNRIVFYFFMFGSLLLLPGAVWEWQTPTAADLWWLGASGATGALGQLFLSRAYEAGEIGVLAPFEFVRLAVAVIIGVVVFAEIPDLWSWAGMAVIFSSVTYIMQRERKLRARTASTGPIT